MSGLWVSAESAVDSTGLLCTCMSLGCFLGVSGCGGDVVVWLETVFLRHSNTVTVPYKQDCTQVYLAVRPATSAEKARRKVSMSTCSPCVAMAASRPPSDAVCCGWNHGFFTHIASPLTLVVVCCAPCTEMPGRLPALRLSVPHPDTVCWVV